MAAIFITNIVVLNNPSKFFDPLRFEIIFECIEELKGDLEWKMIYVGSAESEAYDQILDTITVGPIPEGLHSFIFEADAPDAKRIPGNNKFKITFQQFVRANIVMKHCANIISEEDAVGPTLILLTCSYRDEEFVRVGYFINNDYSDPQLRELPPDRPQFDKLTRNILASKPRVKRFPINWTDTTIATINNLNMNDSPDSTINKFSDDNEIKMDQDDSNEDKINAYQIQ